MNLKKGFLFILLLLGLGSPFCFGESYPPPWDWQVSTPEDQGVDSIGIQAIYQYIFDQKLNTHSLLITRNGTVVSEAYFYPYQKETMVNIHSCTKSIMSALVGIALDEGYLKSIHQKVLDFFPEIKIKNMSAFKKAMTIEDLLTMSSGLAAKNPDTPDDMRETGNWVEYILGLKMAAEPGTRYNYSDCDAHLVSAILQKATCMSTYDYANSRLFKPLGIKAYWPEDPQGIATGWGQINMTPRDMAKFGLLFLNDGNWNGEQIVPAQWVAESTRKHIESNWDGKPDDDYGYYWWIGSDGVISARGSGGQFIYICRPLKTVIVNTNGFNYWDKLDLSRLADWIQSSDGIAANPGSLDKLRDYEAKLQLPAKNESNALPPLALTLSGQIIDFGKKGDPYRSISLDFTRPGEAFLKFITDEKFTEEYRFCMDGGFFQDDSHRVFADTIFLKGYWQDDHTFVGIIEKGERLIFYLSFAGKDVTLRMTDRGGVEIEKMMGKLKHKKVLENR